MLPCCGAEVPDVLMTGVFVGVAADAVAAGWLVPVAAEIGPAMLLEPLTEPFATGSAL